MVSGNLLQHKSVRIGVSHDAKIDEGLNGQDLVKLVGNDVMENARLFALPMAKK